MIRIFLHSVHTNKYLRIQICIVVAVCVFFFLSSPVQMMISLYPNGRAIYSFYVRVIWTVRETEYIHIFNHIVSLPLIDPRAVYYDFELSETTPPKTIMSHTHTIHCSCIHVSLFAHSNAIENVSCRTTTLASVEKKEKK